MKTLSVIPALIALLCASLSFDEVPRKRADTAKAKQMTAKRSSQTVVYPLSKKNGGFEKGKKSGGTERGKKSGGTERG